MGIYLFSFIYLYLYIYTLHSVAVSHGEKRHANAIEKGGVCQLVDRLVVVIPVVGGAWSKWEAGGHSFPITLVHSCTVLSFALPLSLFVGFFSVIALFSARLSCVLFWWSSRIRISAPFLFSTPHAAQQTKTELPDGREMFAGGWRACSFELPFAISACRVRSCTGSEAAC